jgi:hypothetical protein
MIAYIMRYGNQQLSEMETWSYSELITVAAELSEIVKAENGKDDDG